MRHKHQQNYEMNRENGYGVGLYRNKREAKIAGVCAGLADHFDISPWVMRIAFVGAAFMTNFVIIWVYLIAIFALAPKPSDLKSKRDFYEYDEEERCYRKKNIFRYSPSAGERIQRAKARLDKLASRVENMEAYVTSSRYDLDRQFSELNNR